MTALVPIRWVFLTLPLGMGAWSCHKEEIRLPDAPSPVGSFCLNSGTSQAAQFSSPYQRLVWADEFNGPEPEDSSHCFTQAPTCIVRLDEFRADSCPSGFVPSSRLDGLNRCKWNLWAGYSIWDKTSQSAFDPSLVSVENGVLRLRTRWRNDRQAYRCGANASRPKADPGYYDRECRFEFGGVDSNDAGGTTRGRSFKLGRVEIRARLSGAAGSAPAFWTWPVALTRGHPYSYSTWDRWHIGEHDLLETHTAKGRITGFQTYHDWGPPEGKHVWKSGKDFRLTPGEWTRFGLERLPGKVRFYVNDCYTHELKDGDFGMRISDYPNFLMLSMNGEFGYGSSAELDGASVEFDYVRIFE